MKLGPKIVLVNIGALAFFAAAFFAFLYNYYLPRTERAYYTSLTERYTDDALDTLLILHLSAAGDAAGVTDSLNMKLDNYVYELNTLLKQERNAQARDSALALLQKTALHRSTFPRNAENELQSDVDLILAGLQGH